MSIRPRPGWRPSTPRAGAGPGAGGGRARPAHDRVGGRRGGTRGAPAHLSPAPAAPSCWCRRRSSGRTCGTSSRSVSVVAHARRRGLRPFLVEWTDQAADDAGLAHYARHAAAGLPGHRDRADRFRDGRRGRPLAGRHARRGPRRPRPERVAALAVLEAPLRFGAAAGSFAPFVATTPAAVAGTSRRGGVPGASSTWSARPRRPANSPPSRGIDLLRSLADPAALRTHLRVLRWAADEFRMPGALFRDVVERLYRDDAFARGTLEIAGERVGPATLTAPLTPCSPRAARSSRRARSCPCTRPPRRRTSCCCITAATWEWRCSTSACWSGARRTATCGRASWTGWATRLTTVPGWARGYSRRAELAAHDLAVRLAREAGALQVRERAASPRTRSRPTPTTSCRTSTSPARP